jgi:glutamine synthetase
MVSLNSFNASSILFYQLERRNIMTPEKVLAMAKEKGVKVVDLRFMDFPGMWQHFTVPISELTDPASKTALALTAPASAAGSPSTPATCW